MWSQDKQFNFIRACTFQLAGNLVRLAEIWLMLLLSKNFITYLVVKYYQLK